MSCSCNIIPPQKTLLSPQCPKLVMDLLLSYADMSILQMAYCVR